LFAPDTRKLKGTPSIEIFKKTLMATLTQSSLDELLAAPKRGKYTPQFQRDPANKKEIPLQDRDLEIIKEIYENRFMTFSILNPLFPPLPTIPLNPYSKTQQKKQRRLAKLGSKAPEEGSATQIASSGQYSGKNLYTVLAKLYRHYYITRLRTYRGEEHVYALDELGAKVLRGLGYKIKESIDWADQNYDISQRYYHHTLKIARFYAALRVALKEHPTYSRDYRQKLKKIAPPRYEQSCENNSAQEFPMQIQEKISRPVQLWGC
jgi:DNA-binding PadR family transcriptional regulator